MQLTAKQKTMLATLRGFAKLAATQGKAVPWTRGLPGDARSAKALRDKGLVILDRPNPGDNDIFGMRLAPAEVARLREEAAKPDASKVKS